MLAGLNQYVDTHVVDASLEDALASGRYQTVVVTNMPQSKQVEVNAFCHQNNIKFIAADAKGVTGRLFSDFGEAHVISDKDGERANRSLIINITQDEEGVVTVSDDKRHNLETGDYVTFEEVEGMTELNNSEPRKIKVISPFSYSIEDTRGYSSYTGQGYSQQVKMPSTLKQKPLGEVLGDVMSSIVFDVYGKCMPLHCLYQGLSQFQDANNGALPNPANIADAEKVVEYAKAYAASQQPAIEFDEKFVLKLARCSDAVLSPMAAVMGGIAGQEVLKACSGKFSPFNQLLYIDAVEALPEDVLPAEEYEPAGCRYDHQIAVFGRSIQSQIQKLNYFLVGAGAIGCEMLKNWAMMGVATDGGRIDLTDMDQIERSNLNRQFLFRPSDVGQLKSEAAANAIAVMNPDIRVDAKAERVGEQSEDVYDDAFWENLDAVVTALDNVDARLYVDRRCVYFQKPLIDSGTLGTKGNTQVVVPFLTESYGSSRDPPEESTPICTLKNFPHQIQHTIQWARDHFEGSFTQGPQEANKFITKENYIEGLASQPGQQLEAVKTIHKYIVEDKPENFDACLTWARLLFETEFNHKIRQLLHVFPEDSLTSSGSKFWSGTKRAPTPITFDLNDPTHFGFVVAAANLRAFNYNIPAVSDNDYVAGVLKSIVVPAFEPKVLKIAANEEEAKAMEEKAAEEEDHDKVVADLTAQLPSPASLKGQELTAAEFEKDDDTNFHMDFITACSNLRARNYRIKEESKLQTKFIAGKIIPAIATTTAMVTGFVCLELYKVIQKKKLDDYRNTFVNLAIALVAQSEPMPPPKNPGWLKGEETEFTLWDRIDIDIGDVTLQEFMTHFEKEYGLRITMLSYGPAMLYFDFGMGPSKKMKPRLAMKMSEVAQTVGKVELDPKERYLAFEACVEKANSDDDAEIEIPYIRFKFQ